MTGDPADPEAREAEHLPRLPDAADAPRDPFRYDTELAAADEPLDLTAAIVTGRARRLAGDVYTVDQADLAPAAVPYFRYDPATEGVRSDPPPGTRLENGCLVVDD